ncbi:DUF4328 domain-containing protein [Amycolatopsis thermophila]|uniref:DUF4328 domain-containing protein n=1 Tax=Amycolatopsis thermophila TaxID=206084 RepID=A0ABU0ES01_9PSEU|nr:DUF4328 domain-containing protein [Amycolatopsis thermophila]MDQ0378058.1 hypothetical protein [Amycolatopsis thermophila]
MASPPPGAIRPRPARPAERYDGPPSYHVPPRWGFPHLAWRVPTAVPGTPSGYPSPVERVRVLHRNAVTILWFITGLAAIAAGAEFWRYALLVMSRTSALHAATVAFSDALEIIASLLTVVFGLIGIAATLWWLLVARGAAAEAAGQEPARSTREVVAGVLVPGVNLVMAGSIVAELEHLVLGRPPSRRPRPSRLVLAWWAAWVVNGVLMVLVIAWRFKDGVQAMADAVLLTGLLNTSAAVLAGLSAVLVYRFTTLLAPVRPGRLRPLQVRSVKGAPAPELRHARPAGAAR